MSLNDQAWRIRGDGWRAEKSRDGKGLWSVRGPVELRRGRPAAWGEAFDLSRICPCLSGSGIVTDVYPDRRPPEYEFASLGPVEIDPTATPERMEIITSPCTSPPPPARLGQPSPFRAVR